MSAHTPHELHEEFPQDCETLTRLKLTNNHFCNLAGRYHALNRSIHRIEVEIECTSDAYLTRLKKQRLMLLDEIAAMIEEAELHRFAADEVKTPTPAAAGLFGRKDTVPA